MAVPHFLKEEKITEPSLTSLSRPELAHLCKDLMAHVKDLEKLVQVVSEGKYTWEATFDAIQEPVMIVNQDYTIARANLKTAKTGKIEITKLPGKKCFEVFAGRQAPCDACPLEKATQNGEQSHAKLENKIHSKDFEAYAYPFFDEKGNLKQTDMY